MKCVKNMESGKVSRVSDDRASQLVKAGNVIYVPKHIWKAGRVGK